MTILRIAVPAPLHRCFEYLPPVDCIADNLLPGVRVRVPFGKREAIGILISVTQVSAVPEMTLKPALEIMDTTPLLPASLLSLATWASDYYHYPLGEVLAAMLPGLLRKGKAATHRSKKAAKLPEITDVAAKPHVLNDYQQQAVSAVITQLGSFQTFLLNGVTGSGKTEVYLQIIDAVVAAGQQALVLVPEISLTPQTVARFQQRFKVPIAVLHSGLTDRARLNTWVLAAAGQIPIVIGTRSAIFTPLLKPGIIIIDEEHDLSFKQQEGFRYCARDLAIIRGRLESTPVLLGSATPSFESLHNARQKRYQLFELPQRAGTAALPTFHLLDLRNQVLDSGISAPLLARMRQHLQAGGQTLLFLNRRGFAPVLRCQACGWIASCSRCDAKLIYHHRPPVLQCHHCGERRAVDQQCPTCHTTQLFPLGLGTQRLEQVLQKHFPGVGIARIDRDSIAHKDALQDALATINSGESRILVGTQMLAKGHHFPDVSLVAILDADAALFSADFRASERAAQLLLQVGGRAGRADRPGEVLVQTYNPQHPLLAHLVAQNYMGFAQTSLQEREMAGMPPYAHLALIRAEAKTKVRPLQFLTEIAVMSAQLKLAKVDILGPVPSLMERRAGYFRAQLLLQSPQRKDLHLLLKELVARIQKLPAARYVRWSLDVDPLETI